MMIIILFCGLGFRIYPTAVGNLAATRTGPECAIFSANPAHPPLTDGHGKLNNQSNNRFFRIPLFLIKFYFRWWMPVRRPI